jgi:hypothetical protein
MIRQKFEGRVVLTRFQLLKKLDGSHVTFFNVMLGR